MSQSFHGDSFIEAAADAIIAADTDGKIVFWNPAATRIFGFAAEEALGASLDLIIPERFRARHWEGYRTVMSTEKPNISQKCSAFRRAIATARRCPSLYRRSARCAGRG